MCLLFHVMWCTWKVQLVHIRAQVDLSMCLLAATAGLQLAARQPCSWCYMIFGQLAVFNVMHHMLMVLTSLTAVVVMSSHVLNYKYKLQRIAPHHIAT